MEGNIAFKAYLFKDNNDSPAEVRWFYIEQSAIVSFDHVREKLQATFPCLTSNPFTLSWKDCDDDMVAISSDAELLIALTKISSDPRRLYVHVTSQAATRHAATSHAAAHQASTGNTATDRSYVLHTGVVCDACDSEIRGFRYKCVECPDYDLCESCETKREHPEHCFLRITDPLVSSRLRKCLSHQFGRKLFRHCDREPKVDGKKYHGKRHGHSRHGWFEMLTKYMNDVSMVGEDGVNAAANPEGSAGPAPGSGPNACPFTARDVPASGDAHVNYLRNIGQTIANLLDPLGIDVDIDVRSKSAPTSKNETPTSSTNVDNQSRPQTADTTNVNTNAATTANTATNNSTTFIGNAATFGNTTTASQTCNRAVPVFPNCYPVFTSVSAGVSTPIVSAFVNPTPMEAEQGWTLIDSTDVSHNVGSSSASASGSSNNSFTGNVPEDMTNAKMGDSTNSTHSSDATPPKHKTSATNTPTNEPQPQPNPAFTCFPPGMRPPSGPGPLPGFMPDMRPPSGPLPGFMPGMNPPPAPPGFNFDHMARELQKHIQSHFSGAMNVASTVASTVAATAASAAAADAVNKHFTGQNIPSSAAPPTSTGAVPRTQAPPTQNAPAPPTQNVQAQQQQAPPTTKVQAPPTQSVYPNLQAPASAAPTAPPRFESTHKNEKVAQALVTMLGMGFNNEGGWLTSVLECTNGDVTKALDLLQPVKK